MVFFIIPAYILIYTTFFYYMGIKDMEITYLEKLERLEYKLCKDNKRHNTEFSIHKKEIPPKYIEQEKE